MKITSLLAVLLTPTCLAFLAPTQSRVGGSSSRLFDGVGAKDISGLTEDVKTILTSAQIDAILPHRFPFALVDKVVEYEEGKRAVGIKAVTRNEEFFQGHFPSQPVMPGTL
jgi:3-hydroxyacyl-[acyl-carrier-protein] dehydratase